MAGVALVIVAQEVLPFVGRMDGDQVPCSYFLTPDIHGDVHHLRPEPVDFVLEIPALPGPGGIIPYAFVDGYRHVEKSGCHIFFFLRYIRIRAQR